MHLVCDSWHSTLIRCLQVPQCFTPPKPTTAQHHERHSVTKFDMLMLNGGVLVCMRCHANCLQGRGPQGRGGNVAIE
jgi:hypothetical protein